MRFAVLALVFLIQGNPAFAKKPNIVVFLVDDMGWGDLACYGNKIIKSPHLDKFATEGVRFTQCYSACGVCSPSRSAILTGRTPYRNGVWRWIPGGHTTHLRESEITLPELLKENGYATCHVGKWHLNGHFNSDKQPQPNDHGYDHWMATQNNASPNHKNPKNFVLNGKELGLLEGFSAPLVATEGIRWLSEDRDKEKPFLLSVWTHEPHLPIESAEKYMKPYAHIDDEGIRQHHGNITQLDDAFGIVMKGLDDLGLRDNTIVFFTSDNGPEGRKQTGRTQGSTGGLRGRKRDSHEGGIRVAGLVRWPGQIPPGTVSKTPVIGSDIFTTVLGIVGIDTPKDRTIDGADIRPAFKGKAVKRKVPLFWRTHIAPEKSRAAMRIGDWKIVADETLTEFQLYEIEKDWQETTNLAKGKPEKLAEMKKKFMEVWKGIEAEGPREWWEGEPTKTSSRKPKKSAEIGEGRDKSGDWPIVLGGTVTKSDFAYRLTSKGEALALRKLDKPLSGTDRAAFKIDYQTAVDAVTKNAFFCFGDKPDNNSLIKVGTAIGKGTHEIFQGGWINVGRGTAKKAKFDTKQKFTAHIIIDLAKGVVILEVDKTRLEQKLPEDIKKVSYIGLYSKATSSDFSAIEVTK